jgi:hypothetical protein
VASVVRTLLRMPPLNGSDRIAPAIGGFYFWASGRSVTLPASRYNYSSDWTPLLVRLSLTGMAASLAAPERQLMLGDRTNRRATMQRSDFQPRPFIP